MREVAEFHQSCGVGTTESVLGFRVELLDYVVYAVFERAAMQLALKIDVVLGLIHNAEGTTTNLIYNLWLVK